MSDLAEVLRDVILSTTEYVGSGGITNSETVASSCLAALEAAGYRVVPVEPTEAMLDAGGIAVYDYLTDDTEAQCWSAMLAAAPKVTG